MRYACAAAFLAAILLANYVTTEVGDVTLFGITATAGTLLAGLTFVLRDTLQDTIRASLPGRIEYVQTRYELPGGKSLPGPIRGEWTPPTDGQVALRVAAVIAAGAALSFAVSAPAIAVASAAAFALAELADLGIYTPLRRKGYVRAAVASNVVGAVVDTFVFLWLAAPFLSSIIPGFSITGMAPGQVAGKLAVTAAVVLPVLAYRAHRAKVRGQAQARHWRESAELAG